ncbi:uroporphyrinogen-III synthase [Rhizobium sp. CFBP 8762]|uniref:uroporphyrinogen-III synthase n=1 Tax=Rhizobium sp. CFBP 8762 TaxID=2775279 RepID=UPI00177D1E23|nr:uroporphyrinogen-III synthase [Rhizobium sp. CFBP 8762]MBD8555480.1 uroporphyrinogen-III synthase [Rhizobium sp. CFBP 8762]
MRVLVTRPQPAARLTAERVEAMGHIATELPLFEARHRRDEAFAALSQPHAAIAVTSAEAIRALGDNEAMLSPHVETPVYAVGQATAQAARTAGFRHVVTGEGTGEALADIIIADRPGPVLYLAGTPRSCTFEMKLSRAGIVRTIVKCYRMEPLHYDRAKLSKVIELPPDVVLLYSKQAAVQLCRLLGVEIVASLTCLCLSQKVAQALPENSANILVSATPDEAALLQLLAFTDKF